MGGSSSKVLEDILVAAGDVTASLGGESSDKIETTAFLKLDKYQKYCAIGTIQGCASDSVITLTMLQATAAAGTNSKTISTTVTDTATSTNVTDLLIVTVEVDASLLDTGSSFYFAGARMATSNGSGTEAATIAHFRAEARYDPQSN